VSKAFTKEDEIPEEVVPSAPRLAPGEVRYVTPDGYKALQDELASLDPGSRRAQALHALLPILTVHAPRCDGRATFGCWVRLRDEEGREASWRIVGPDEADAKARKLSASSPLARALLGKEGGETISVELPRGPAEYEILEVRDTEPGR